MRHHIAFAATLALGACSQGPIGADVYELANIRPDHVVPKSSPAQFVAGFRRHCVGASGAQRDAGLRAADYVPVPRRGRVQAWAVDTRAPLVMTQPGACAVAAQSRTGQASRVAAMIARDYPTARPVTVPGAEAAWIVPGALITTNRTGAPSTPASYTLSILNR